MLNKNDLLGSQNDVDKWLDGSMTQAKARILDKWFYNTTTKKNVYVFLIEENKGVLSSANGRGYPCLLIAWCLGLCQLMSEDA